MSLDFLKTRGLPDHFSLALVNLFFLLVFLTWVLLDIMRERRFGTGKWTRSVDRASSIWTTVAILCNFMISLLHLELSLHGYWNLRKIDYNSTSTAVAWLAAFFLAIYTTRKRRVWPVVLHLWWVYSTVCFAVSVFIIRWGDETRHPLEMVTMIDMASFLFCLVLCASVIVTTSCCCNTYHEPSEKEHPFLRPKEEFEEEIQECFFDDAGIWSRVTFKWLNPLLKTGHTQKLELHHIPPIPQSETAEHASSLLEESLLRKHISAGPPSSMLLEALSYAIWRSLLINGIIAGIKLTYIT